MTRSEFVQEIFLQLYPLFVDELTEYDEAIGNSAKKLSEVYIDAFNMASQAADMAANSLEIAKVENENFWEKSN